MNKKLLKLITLLTSAAMCATLLSALPTTAQQTQVLQTEQQFGEGLIPESEEELNAFADEFEDFNLKMSRSATLPLSVDLSTDPCFPPIGNQGGIGSCTSWASTYYQYSYEVNKLNNVTSSDDRVIYSPKWTYNNVNKGLNKGTSYSDSYRLLKNQGALTQEQFPYPASANTSNYDVKELPTYDGAVSDMRDALKTRLISYGTQSISGSGTAITSCGDSSLSTIKHILNARKVLTFQTWNEFNYKTGTGAYSNTKLVYRGYDSNGSSHAMTVVGYDDNVTCDINGDGVIDNSEKGAFKVINSWGLTNSGANNNGVIWIMYDALNGVSANNLDESSFAYSRKPAMGTGTNNVFNIITVGHKDVVYAAEVSFSTNYRNQVEIGLGRSDQYANSSFTMQTALSSSSAYASTSVPYDGTMVFDFGSLANSVSDYHEGYYWRVKVTDTTDDDNKATCNQIKITDDRGKVIRDIQCSGKTLDNYTFAPVVKIDLSKGDLTYDGILDDDDVNVLGYYIYGGRRNVSHLQLYLGDMDDSGAWNGTDIATVGRLVIGLDPI